MLVSMLRVAMNLTGCYAMLLPLAQLLCLPVMKANEHQAWQHALSPLMAVVRDEEVCDASQHSYRSGT
jgi:hypothetical protein